MGSNFFHEFNEISFLYFLLLMFLSVVLLTNPYAFWTYFFTFLIFLLFLHIVECATWYAFEYSCKVHIVVLIFCRHNFCINCIAFAVFSTPTWVPTKSSFYGDELTTDTHADSLHLCVLLAYFKTFLMRFTQRLQCHSRKFRAFRWLLPIPLRIASLRNRFSSISPALQYMYAVFIPYSSMAMAIPLPPAAAPYAPIASSSNIAIKCFEVHLAFARVVLCAVHHSL